MRESPTVPNGKNGAHRAEPARRLRTRAYFSHGSSSLTFQRLQQATGILLLVGLCAFASLRSPTFLTWRNIVENLFANAAPLGIMSLGMTFVMIAGGFDLSVASITATCSVVLVMTMDRVAPAGPAAAIAAGVLLTLLTGCALGTANGVLIAKVGVNPFVATLSTMLVFRGAALILTGGGQAQQVHDLTLRGRFTWLYDASVPLGPAGLSIPLPVVVFLLCFLLAGYLLRLTRFGHYTYAIGGNEEAARLAGINTRRIKGATYTICGLSCAIAAMIYVAMTETAQPESHQGKELDVIAAVIVGGTPLGGGSGGLTATVIGLLLLRVIDNLLTQFSVGTEYRKVLTGCIILLVVTVDVLTRKRARS